MTALAWDQVGERLYETGVDHGVLYMPNEAGVYADGVAWNGLTAITESPSGAESTPLYADNIKYLNLISAEEFGATIEAFTYPDEFALYDGTASPQVGVSIGQQSRKNFGLSYRTQLGNDVEGADFGYKLHLIYGAIAAPSEKGYATINDAPEAISFSWDVTTTPVAVAGYKPTAQLVVDSTKVDVAALAALELLLYGSGGADPQLPLPGTVIALFAGTITEVSTSGANSPTYVAGTHVVTLPAVVGITWKVNGVTKVAGAQPAMTIGQSSLVTAVPDDGYVVESGDVSAWNFDF